MGGKHSTQIEMEQPAHCRSRPGIKQRNSVPICATPSNAPLPRNLSGLTPRTDDLRRCELTESGTSLPPNSHRHQSGRVLSLDARLHLCPMKITVGCVPILLRVSWKAHILPPARGWLVMLFYTSSRIPKSTALSLQPARRVGTCCNNRGFRIFPRTLRLSHG